MVTCTQFQVLRLRCSKFWFMRNAKISERPWLSMLLLLLLLSLIICPSCLLTGFPAVWIVINLRYYVCQHLGNVLWSFLFFIFYRYIIIIYKYFLLFLFRLRPPHLLFTCLLGMCWQPVRHLLPCHFSMWCVSLLLCSLMSL